jgi:hypothetical protein
MTRWTNTNELPWSGVEEVNKAEESYSRKKWRRRTGVLPVSEGKAGEREEQVGASGSSRTSRCSGSDGQERG